MSDTSIQWTDKTWNPVRGCSVVSPGCVNCYAMKQAHRFSSEGKAYAGLTKQTSAGPQWTGRVALAENQLLEPLKWKHPTRVFVNSMSDLFHESMPDEWIDQVFAVMALSTQHTFQILTKRANRMRAYFADAVTRERIADVIGFNHGNQDTARSVLGGQFDLAPRVRWPLTNVWLGVSVENQKYADERIPLLMQTPAAIRFISAEPLLEPVSLHPPADKAFQLLSRYYSKEGFDASGSQPEAKRNTTLFPKLDWVIVGGESGNGARQFDVAWARSILKQCAAAKVACFVKQLGKQWAGAQPDNGQPWDRKGGVMDEWPSDLRVRQFPNHSPSTADVRNAGASST